MCPDDNSRTSLQAKIEENYLLAVTEHFNLQILPGEIAPTLDELYQEYVRELTSINPEVPSIEEMLRMLKWCPISSTCVSLKAERALIAIGRYTHPDKTLHRTLRGEQTIEEWVNGNFDSMEGSILDVWLKMLRQCYGLGCSSAEPVFVNNQPGFGRQWRLKKIIVLPRRRYRFAGSQGNWDRIIYFGWRRRYPIPRRKLLHTYLPDIDESEDPRGDAPSIRAYPFWKSRTLAYKYWSITTMRHATGTWILKGDDNDTVTKTDERGNPVRKPDGSLDTEPAVYRVVREVRQAAEGSVVGLSKRIDAQFYANTSTGGMAQDFNTALTDYKNNILYSYGIPKTIFDEGSATLGQSGLNAGHRLILDIQSESMVIRLRDQMINQVIRPLLVANFGKQYEDSLGKFESEQFVPPEIRGQIVTNISQATSIGVLDANDINVQNAARRACGIAELSTEKFDQLQVQRILQQNQDSG